MKSHIKDGLKTFDEGHRFSAIWLSCLVVASLCLSSNGCGRAGQETKVIHGTVSVGGEMVDSGQVRFVPIDGTPGPIGFSDIVDGQYRIDVRGGVPLGKHRVEVAAFKKTGRKVRGRGPIGDEMTMVDEKIPIGSKEYAGENSPLTVEITTSSDPKIELDIPAGNQ